MVVQFDNNLAKFAEIIESQTGISLKGKKVQVQLEGQAVHFKRSFLAK